MSITNRPAVADDAADIARLFLISSDGLAEYIWTLVKEPGETVLEAGTRRYRRSGVAFSYQNCLIAEVDGRPAGMAHSYPMVVDPDAAPESDPVLRPYSELEDDGSLYLSGIAVNEDARGKGIGSRLMVAVFQRTSELGLPRLSLICFERNEGAMRMDRRLGFREAARRPLEPHPLLRYQDGDAVLLVAEAD